MAGYFLTGETVSSRGILKPLRNFDVRPGKRGLGAIELIGRYNYLNIGHQVFRAASPTRTSGPTSSTLSTPGSTGTGPSTSRSTSAGSTPASATRSCSPRSVFTRPVTSTGCGSRSTSRLQKCFSRDAPHRLVAGPQNFFRAAASSAKISKILSKLLTLKASWITGRRQQSLILPLTS